MNRADFVADLERRRKTLEREIGEWKQRADGGGQGGLGLHRVQLGQVKRSLDELMAKRAKLVENLDPQATGAALADAYIEVLEEIVGAGELWRIYQTGIEQHSISPFAKLVHEATLTAVEVVDAVFFVAPPTGDRPAPAMIYLDPSLSPAAGGRLMAAGDSGFVVRRFRAELLPVPLLLLPADQSTSYWSLTHLAHEIGHLVDHELGRVQGGQRLTLTQDLKRSLGTALTAAQTPDERVRRWLRWSEELLADAFALSLGGAAYASALSSLLLPLAQASRFSRLDGAGTGQLRSPHPPPLLRQHILLQLMTQAGSTDVMLMKATLEGDWANVPAPPFFADFESDLSVVAPTLWDFPLVPGGKKLRDLLPFAPDPRFAHLVEYLADGTKPRPSANNPDKLPRLQVALAAELARRKKGGADLEGIHERALTFAGTINWVEFAAAAQDGVKARAAALLFSKGKAEEEP